MRLKVFLLVLLALLNGLIANANGKIKMIFRYDDYLLVPSQLNDSIVSIFKKNDIPLCIGIIPFGTNNMLINQLTQNQFSDLIARIKRNELEVCLHGFNHISIVKKTFLKRQYYSEFATESCEIQYNKIEKGKNVLDSLLQTNITVFIPPYNTYDANTLKALEKSRFGIISGNMSGAYSSDSLKYMPETYKDFWGLSEIINTHINDDATIIVYFHPYSFKGGSTENIEQDKSSMLITMNQLDSVLSCIKKQQVSFYRFSDLAANGHYDKALYKANFLNKNLLKKILDKVNHYRYGLYLTMEYNMKHRFIFYWNILFHLLCFVLVYYIVSKVIQMFRPKSYIVFSFLFVLLSIIILYLYYFSSDIGFDMKLIILSTIFLALALGVVRNYKQLVRHQ